jgi:hypothetical protein
LPYETSYYPAGSGRDEARPVEIRSAGEHLTGIDLMAGKPVAFRELRVKVKFPDGAPMVTAQVDISGEPVKSGDLPWQATRIADKTGSVSLFAPANRRLTIEVRDWHRRDLKAGYVSTHEPGADPILREFVVRDILSP